MTSTQLRRRVLATLGAALLASIAANVLAAEPTVVARCVAAWPPVALMLTVDVLGRVPTADGRVGRVTTVAAGVVALVAAIASFSHVRAVALLVGESDLVAWLLPLSIDGLAVVCSIALVEINRRTTPPAQFAGEAQPTLSATESKTVDRQPADQSPLLFTASTSPATVGNGNQPHTENQTRK